MRTVFTILPAVLFVLTNCGGGPSDGDVREATEGIKSVYGGLYQILEENKAEPARAVAEGEKFVESKKDELAEHGRVLGKGMSAEQIQIVEAFQSDLQDMGRKSAQSLKSSFANSPEEVRKLGQILDKLGNYYVAAARENEGAISRAVSGAGMAAAKKAIVATAKETAGDIPEMARDQMLDTWTEGLAAQGADEAAVKEFREELKNELGW